MTLSELDSQLISETDDGETDSDKENEPNTATKNITFKVNGDDIDRKYPRLVFSSLMCDGMSDIYRIHVRRSPSAENEDYMIFITQRGCFPLRGYQEIRLNVEQFKALENNFYHLEHFLRMFVREDLSEEASTKAYHIAGCIHADVQHVPYRGPCVILYMALFDHVTSQMSKDVFGVVSLDEEAFYELKVKIQEVNKKVPYIAQYVGCFGRHQGVLESVYCNECCPRGFQYIG